MNKLIRHGSQFLIALLLMVSFSGCCTIFCSPPTEASCPINELLLKVTDLPGNGWTESGSRSSKGAPQRIGVERIGTSFLGIGLFDGVNHEIYRTEDEQSAYRAFVDVEEEDFSVQNYLQDWEVPSELSRVQLSTNIQKIGCNIYKNSGAEECKLVAQYGSYLVRFSIRLHGLHFNEVAPILDNIDTKMMECILPK